MFGRIDRYISMLFLGFLAGGLLVFVTLFVAIDAMSMLVQFEGLTGAVLLKYYALALPEVIYQMLPMACLVGVLFSLSSLNRNNELVALFASGMSLARIAAPILGWVLFLSAMAFVVADTSFPRIAQEKNFVYYHDIRKKPGLYSTVKTNRIWYRFRNSIFNIQSLNDKTQTAQGLTLYYFTPTWDLIQMLTANHVQIEGTQWKLKEGSVTIFTGDSSFPLTSDFKTKTIVMEEDLTDIQKTAHSTDVLSIKELKSYIHKNKDAGLDTVYFEVGYFAKFAFGFAGLVMSLLAIPFAIARGRSGGAMMNVGVSLLLVFTYWTLYNASLTLGYHGHFPPFLAAWAPNALGILVALFLFKKSNR